MHSQAYLHGHLPESRYMNRNKQIKGYYPCLQVAFLGCVKYHQQNSFSGEQNMNFRYGEQGSGEQSINCASVFLPTVLCKWRNEEFCVDITLRYSLCNSDHSLYCHSIKSLENPVSWSCCCSAVPKFYHGKRTWCPLWQDLLDGGCVPLRMHL